MVVVGKELERWLFDLQSTMCNTLRKILSRATMSHGKMKFELWVSVYNRTHKFPVKSQLNLSGVWLAGADDVGSKPDFIYSKCDGNSRESGPVRTPPVPVEDRGTVDGTDKVDQRTVGLSTTSGCRSTVGTQRAQS